MSDTIRPARPSALFSGARIALVAPSGPVVPERLECAVRRCTDLDLVPVVFPSTGLQHRYLAGTDAQRLEDLQAAFDDRTIDGVWALRGGYGTLRILDQLDLARQELDPIPFIGFSDNTTIHLRHAAANVISFHGPHPGSSTSVGAPSDSWFRRLLFSDQVPGPLPQLDGEPSPKTLVEGRAEGRLFGGNLAMVASMCGGPTPLVAEGCILFLEDVGEPAYRVDRMLIQLERAGVLRGVRALAFGRFNGCAEQERLQVHEVLEEFSERIGVPAVADLPFGHIEQNFALPLGVRAVLDASQPLLTIAEAAVVLRRGPQGSSDK